MDKPPFQECNQLNRELEFGIINQVPCLSRTDGKAPCLPGQPRVDLQDPSLHHYLLDNLLVPELNSAVAWLWLVGTPRSSHISALHHQEVRGRSIILTENPRLHLIWWYDKVFIKPMPAYLLSHAFWEYLATQSPEFKKAAIGFVRTYAWLVRYESDFKIAIEKQLLPNSMVGAGNGETPGPMTYEHFCKFIAPFETLGDEHVAPRYQYGELRLTRLNFYSRLFLKRWSYHHIEAQWATFLGSLLAPFIVVFAIFTVVLSAVQVELGAMRMTSEASDDANVKATDQAWGTFMTFSIWYPLFTLFFVASVVLVLMATILIMFVHDQFFAFRVLKEKRKDPDGESWRRTKSAVV